MRLYVNLDIASPELVLERELSAGEPFDVGLVVEQDEAAGKPIAFDTLIFEIWSSPALTDT